MHPAPLEGLCDVIGNVRRIPGYCLDVDARELFIDITLLIRMKIHIQGGPKTRNRRREHNAAKMEPVIDNDVLE